MAILAIFQGINGFSTNFYLAPLIKIGIEWTKKHEADSVIYNTGGSRYSRAFIREFAYSWSKKVYQTSGFTVFSSFSSHWFTQRKD